MNLICLAFLGKLFMKAENNICAFRGKRGNKACIISVSRTFLLYRATVSFNKLLHLIVD